MSVVITPQAIQGSSTPLQLPCRQIKGSDGGGSIQLRHGSVECEQSAIFEGGCCGRPRWIGTDIFSPFSYKRSSNTRDLQDGGDGVLLEREGTAGRHCWPGLFSYISFLNMVISTPRNFAIFFETVSRRRSFLTIS